MDGSGRRAGHRLAAVSALLLSLVFAATAQAQAPAGVGVEQGYGFATVSWEAVAGASEYQIERTLLDGDTPAAPAVIVGRWMPNRYTAQGRTGGETTFADSGFVLGERYRWRVRGVTGGVPGDWSAPVDGDTLDVIGPAEHRTPFEQAGGARFTLHEEEVAYLRAIDAASERVRLTQVGSTAQGRPLFLATVGHPAPKSPAEIAASPAVAIECTIHGGERAPREACMILLRWLGFSNDVWAARILSQATVLIYPTANPDGQALGTRENTAGQDLNRDHLLIRHPETFAMAEIVRDHRPEMFVDGHELGSGPDIQWLWPRSPGVGEELWRLTQEQMTRAAMFDASAEFGWSSAIWPTHRLDNWETLIQNTAGLKNMVGQLEETPQQSGAARPGAPSGSAANMQRRVYTHLWSFRQHLDYHHYNLPAIQSAIAAAERTHESNDGPIYLDGARDVPVPPPDQEPSTKILDPPPCGYRLTAEQYAQRDGSAPGDEVQWSSHTVAERLAAHGIEVEQIGAGMVDVLLGQRLRAAIPYILDPDLESPVRPLGTPNIGMVEAVRLADRGPTVVIGATSSGVPNRVDDVSCSIDDRIADEQPWPSKGAFQSHVTGVVEELRNDGLISGKEGGAITSAAARSAVGR
jgi:Zinc carboxypeptidase